MGKRFVSIGECMVEMSGGEARNYRLGFAGDTLNTAWYARALLEEDWQVDYVTALGDDLYSTQMRAFFAENRIGTDHIATVPGRRPGLYLIHQADGDRHFTYWRDRSAARLLADDKAALDKALAGAGLVYFSGITLAILEDAARERLLGAIAAARASGAQVAFDPNIRPALWPDTETMRAVLTRGASLADIVLPTHGDEKPIFGDTDPAATAARYRALGVSEVVVKDGADPALVVSAAGTDTVAPRPDAVVVDATGAGDSFNGAYLSARLAGTPPGEAAAKAHAVAARVIAHKGALIEKALLA